MLKIILFLVAGATLLGFLVWLLLHFQKQGKLESLNNFMEGALNVQKKILDSFADRERTRHRNIRVRVDVLRRIEERRRSLSGDDRVSNDTE